VHTLYARPKGLRAARLDHVGREVSFRFFPLLLLLAGSCKDSTASLTGSGVRELWYQAQPGSSRSRPAISGGVVFFGTGDGQIIARDAASGAALWSTKVSQDGIEGANILARKNVVIAASIFHVVGLDARTGRELWRYLSPKDTVGTSPSAAPPGSLANTRLDADDEMVYVPAWGASVSALDVTTGTVRWVWQPGITSTDTAASGMFRSGSMGVRVSGDTVFATLWHFTNRAGGTSDAWLVALDRRLGNEFWRVRLPGDGSGVMIEAAPAVFQNLIIVQTVSARTFAVDRTSREISWEFSAPARTSSTLAGPEVSGETVYVDGGDGNIYALHGASGAVVWQGRYGLASSTDMTLTERHVIFASGTELHILDRQTGRALVTAMQPHTSDPLFGSPALFANGALFVTVGGAAWAFVDP
jgi:outer membrane protein assembly factor BamB